jgi:hypothetical protein
MSNQNEHPKAVQGILDKLDELIDVVKQQREHNPVQETAKKRERNPRS